VGLLYLHGDDSVVDDGLFCEEICADGCFVLGAELLVHLPSASEAPGLGYVLVHQ
jgi:hypothetical protein